MGKLLCEIFLRDVWCRNESVRAEIGQILQTHRQTHASKLDLTRFNKIAIQGTPQMAVDKEAICLSRVYSYYPKCNFPLFYV